MLFTRGSLRGIRLGEGGEGRGEVGRWGEGAGGVVGTRDNVKKKSTSGVKV